MEPEFCFALYDFYWFQTLILRQLSLPPLPAPTTPVIAVGPRGGPTPQPQPQTILLRRRHRRSRSDDLAPFPALQIQPPKLNTILSGRVVPGVDMHPILPPEGGNKRFVKWDRYRREIMKRRGKNGESKSLTDLEFEELKGLKDLGFTFPDAEAADPRILSIVPGIQRLRAEARNRSYLSNDTTSSSASDASEDCAVARAPYLSEAWDAAVAEEVEEKRNDILRNWRIPAAGEGIDMKDHLRLWAQAVASAVR